MERLIPPGGHLVLTCPHFLNARGLIWMTLQTLLDVPMSLSDLHFIAPFDIEDWISGSSLQLVGIDTFDHSRGNGRQMLTDLRKRLRNALTDAGLTASRVDEFVNWLERVVQHWEATGGPALDGATARYTLRRADG